MRLAARLVASASILALMLLVLWRILATGMSDHFASNGQLRKALDWDRNNPVALVALASEQLDQGKIDQAAGSARNVLQREPLNAQAFVILAETAASASGSDNNQAMKMNAAAIRRAPYAVGARARLANVQLSEGKYREALENLDGSLQISAAQHAAIFAAFIELAANAEFADALVAKLSARPVWRDSFVSSVFSSASPEQLAVVLSALQRNGELDQQTTGRWIDRLIKDGQWGEAYARWVGGLQPSAPYLKFVYNGDFEVPPSGTGFDWRIGDSAGVLVDRVARSGSTRNHALSLTFLDRRVEVIPVHQWLMLGSGSYRLSFSASAFNLRSDRGVQWVIRCADDGSELAESERLTGHFGWKQFELRFDVPASECTAQDLWLRNAGSAAAGKMIGGAIMFDDVEISR